MMRRGQRGILLLPVALTLAITGALAYAMTRDGSMDVAAIDAEYDMEVARYLAEAGLQLTKWQNERIGCKSKLAFGTLSLPGGQVVADKVDEGAGQLTVSLTTTTARGSVNRVTDRKLRMHRTVAAEPWTSKEADISDAFIRQGSTAQGKTTYLETTDGFSHGLLKFGFPGAMDDAVVLSAELSLTQIDSKSTQPQQSLALHRLTRDWPQDGSTWIAPWSTAGGDYVAALVATRAIDGNAQYSWRIDALVESWVDGAVPNFGLLLKPSGLLEARFASVENKDYPKPKLVVRYLPRC